jgi:S1-C subfamily serine protease
LDWLDPLVLLWIALSALVGYQRGLTAQVLSLAGLVLGGLAGSRLAPLFLAGGKSSPWVPFASLLGAVIGAILLQVGASVLGGMLRTAVLRGPLRMADALGGTLAGAIIGLGVAWLAGVAALQLPQSGMRRTVQDSAILSSLIEAAPPGSVLQALARFDPLPLIAASPDASLPPPDPSILDDPVARRAARSVVKVTGVACGLGLQGSGWVVQPGLVATNAHVVAGTSSNRIEAPDGESVRARPVYVDRVNDVALLAAPGLRAQALPVARAQPGSQPVVLLGYPLNGGLKAIAGAAGAPRKVLAPDAYGGRLRLRSIVPLRARVQHGDSGGPVVNARGRVVAMIFGATKNGTGGFGVPVAEVVQGLSTPLRPVSSGPCT